MTVSLHAQTEWKDRYISIAREHQLNPSVAHPSQPGTTVTVWEDERDDLTGADIYIQQIDNETGVPRWIAPKIGIDVVTDRFDGIPVCQAEFDQRNPRVAYDNLDGVIVVWEDYRNDPTQTVAEIWAQRIDLSTGLPDPTWPLDGIPVCQTGYHAERPRIVGTMDGVFITWIDHRNNTGRPVNRDVYLQYIKSATASFPPPPTNWVVNGISVSASSQHDQINPELDTDNIITLDLLNQMTQGVVVTYQDNRYLGASTGLPVWTVFVNRISADGAQMYTFGGLGGDVAVDATTLEHQRFPRVVTTGKIPYTTDRRAVIVWEDDIGVQTGTSTDIYSQALSNLGYPPLYQPGQPFWATTTPVCLAPEEQIKPIPVLFEYYSQATQVYQPYVTVGWEDFRDYPITGIDLYGGLIDVLAPAVINPGNIAGDIISALPNDQTQLSMDHMQQSLIYDHTVFVWSHFNGQDTDIHYQKVRIPGWILTEPLNGFPVTEAKAAQVLPQASRDVFVWQDGRRDPIPNDYQDDENIYAQTPGECTGATGMKWRDEFAYWSYGEDAENFRMVSDPDDGSIFIVWDETRYPAGHPSTGSKIVFIQKIDKDGVPRWSNNGVALPNYYSTSGFTFTDLATNPDVCIDGSGGARAIWQQRTSGTGQYECWATQINAAGVLSTYTGGTFSALLNPGTHSYDPRIVAVNAGNRAAVVGVLQDAGGGKQLRLSEWTVFGNMIVNRLPIPYGGSHTDLHITYDGANCVIAIADDVLGSSITVAEFDLMNLTNNCVSIPYQSLHGMDINTDELLAANGDALFTYSALTSGNTTPNVYFGRYDVSSGTVHISPVTTYNAPNLAKSPAITADSVLGVGGFAMGALLAWDTQYNDPVSGVPYHRVETNQHVMNSLVPMQSGNQFSQHAILTSGLTAESNPDIAKVISTTPSITPYSVVVWEGGGETSSCSPPRPVEVYGQYVEYKSTLPPSLSALWPQPEMIGPGPGNYTQTRPTVKASLPGTVAVFWDDTQTNNTGIMGTRIPLDDFGVVWAKATTNETQAIPPTSLAFADVWPQPASLGGEVTTTLCSVENATLSLELYDMLGRRVSILYEGTMLSSQLTVRFVPSQLGLRTGIYLLQARSGEMQISRSIVIIR